MATGLTTPVGECIEFCFHTFFCRCWWWRQFTPLKHRSTPTRLHGGITRKALIFIVASVRTWNLTFRIYLVQIHTHTHYKPIQSLKAFCPLYHFVNKFTFLCRILGLCLSTYLVLKRIPWRADERDRKLWADSPLGGHMEQKVSPV
jgi:hypothetical protein